MMFYFRPRPQTVLAGRPDLEKAVSFHSESLRQTPLPDFFFFKILPKLPLALQKGMMEKFSPFAFLTGK